jgi:hypothetical protein
VEEVMSITDDFYSNIDRANDLMEELNDLAASAVTAGVLTEDEYRGFDPYAASEQIEILDNARIDAGEVSAQLLQQSGELVAHLMSDVESFRARLTPSTTRRNNTIILSTLAAGFGACALVGLFAYWGRAR